MCETRLVLRSGDGVKSIASGSSPALAPDLWPHTLWVRDRLLTAANRVRVPVGLPVLSGRLLSGLRTLPFKERNAGSNPVGRTRVNALVTDRRYERRTRNWS